MRCFRPPRSQAAHISKFGDSGIAIKGSDDRTVPLCYLCHSLQHRTGEITFWGGEYLVRQAISFAKSLVGANYEETVNKILLGKWK